MITKRDQTFRDQPSLFDQGQESRNETYGAVVERHPSDRQLWLSRVVAAGPHGITLDELSHRYDVPAHRISGRITELAKARAVVRTAARRETRASTPVKKITAAVIVAQQFLN